MQTPDSEGNRFIPREHNISEHRQRDGFRYDRERRSPGKRGSEGPSRPVRAGRGCIRHPLHLHALRAVGYSRGTGGAWDVEICLRYKEDIFPKPLPLVGLINGGACPQAAVTQYMRVSNGLGASRRFGYPSIAPYAAGTAAGDLEYGRYEENDNSRSWHEPSAPGGDHLMNQSP